MSSLQSEFWSTSLLKVKMCSILECSELNLLTILPLVSTLCTIINILNPYLERKSIHIPGFTAVLLILSMIWKLPKGSSKDEWIKFVCVSIYTHTHTHIYTHNAVLFSPQRNEILFFCDNIGGHQEYNAK